MKFVEKFIPQKKATNKEYLRSSRILIIEGAVASIIYAVSTNNIMTGYLTYLGASVSLCALLALFPQLGCVLQFVSPFLFERFRYRKFAIWSLCLIFRLSVAFTFLFPLLLYENIRLGTVIGLYALAFAAAGLVTPGLQQFIINIVDVGHRGSYMAKKDIFAAGVNSIALLVISRNLDLLKEAGKEEKGYQMIGFLCLVLVLVDALLLLNVTERPVEKSVKMNAGDLFQPMKDQTFRPLLLYNVVSGMANGIAGPFMIVYQLRVLGLSHTFLASVGIVSAISGMTGSYLWGKFSDRNTWDKTIRCTATIGLSCTLVWAFITPESAYFVAPVLMVISAACGSGAAIANLNLQYSASPASGKTLYLGFTAATVSIIGSFITFLSATIVQPYLAHYLGDKSISVLFIFTGIGGFLNLLINGRKLPHIK